MDILDLLLTVSFSILVGFCIYSIIDEVRKGCDDDKAD